MKKSIRAILVGLLVVPILALGINLSSPIVQPASAVDEFTVKGGADTAKGSTGVTCLFTGSCDDGEEGIFTTIINVMLYIIGAIGVVMLIYGGIRYTTSGGNATYVTAAKNTILYAIVGIVVAMLAYAIVNFVIGRLTV